MLPTPTKTSPYLRSGSARASGFTLVELLMVIAVILILAGITFGVSRGVQNAQSRAKVKAELAVIAQALEQFKATYGDYPRIPTTSNIENADDLLKALTGWKKLERDSAGDVNMSGDLSSQAKMFLDPSKIATSAPVPVDEAPGDQYFTDPWGSPYVYIYNRTNTGNAWDNFGYILLSTGPDGSIGLNGVDSDGIIDTAFLDDTANLDNIMVGE